MNTQRTGTHLVSTALLLLWGGILIYFYWNGRIVKYLTEDGYFRPMALWGGVGMIILGLYNLATIGSKEAACCEHEHGHGDGHDHDHDHGHGHDHHHDHGHAHKDGCCGHDHKHEPDHKHDHGHTHETHDHGHEHRPGHGHVHVHKEGECCGHDHKHEHEHEHAHSHAHSHTSDAHACCDHKHEHHHHDHGHAHEGGEHSHGHAHGILEESGSIGRWVAIILLVVPVTYAAIKSPDAYSKEYILKKDKQKYGKGGSSERFARSAAPRPDADPAVAASPPTSVTPSSPDNVASAPPSRPVPPTLPTELPDPSKGPAPAVDSKEVDRQAAKTPTEAKSYGTFTLADLKAQIQQSPEGNFMLEVPELYYTAGDKEVQAVLNGQPVETIAQVLPEKVNNEDGSRVRIFRLQVQCCAADARPFSIPVEFGKTAPVFKDMTWVKVAGKITYQKEGDQIVPLLEATSMIETAEPANSMVY